MRVTKPVTRNSLDLVQQRQAEKTHSLAVTCRGDEKHSVSAIAVPTQGVTVSP